MVRNNDTMRMFTLEYDFSPKKRAAVPLIDLNVQINIRVFRLMVLHYLTHMCLASRYMSVFGGFFFSKKSRHKTALSSSSSSSSSSSNSSSSSSSSSISSSSSGGIR